MSPTLTTKVPRIDGDAAVPVGALKIGDKRAHGRRISPAVARTI
jgi:hypothetical protein